MITPVLDLWAKDTPFAESGSDGRKRPEFVETVPCSTL